MAESIRSILVHVEVDTTKNTYSLYLDKLDSIDEIQEHVAEFVNGLDL